MNAPSTFSIDALHASILSNLGIDVETDVIKKIAADACIPSCESSVLAKANEMGPFFYNVVFMSMDHTPMSSPLFITVKTSTRISYGSDLLALREALQKMLNYTDLVITSYTELAGPLRPDQVLPTIAIAQSEAHRKPS